MRSLPAAPAAGLASILPDQPAGSLALAAAVASTAPAPHPDAALIDLGRRWAGVRQIDIELAEKEANGTLTLQEWIAAAEPVSIQQNEIGRAVAATPATTFAGLAVKARILAYAGDCWPQDDPGIMAWAYAIGGTSPLLDQSVGSLVADILRLAQEQQP